MLYICCGSAFLSFHFCVCHQKLEMYTINCCLSAFTLWAQCNGLFSTFFFDAANLLLLVLFCFLVTHTAVHNFSFWNLKICFYWIGVWLLSLLPLGESIWLWLPLLLLALMLYFWVHFFFYFSDVAYESAKSLDLVENSSTVLFIESQCN